MSMHDSSVHDLVHLEPPRPSGEWPIKLATGWSSRRRAPWTVLHKPGTILPAAGWKVHVSSSLEAAEETLARAAPIFFDLGIAFKMLSSPDEYLRAHAKDANRVQSGKFIAAYPPDEVGARHLMRRLAATLYDLPGQPVLTDRSFEGSRNVHYRYGGFTEAFELEADGSAHSVVIDRDSIRRKDAREPRFVMPDGVVDPFVDPHSAAGADTSRGRLELDRFTVESAIMFSNAGGVYVARARNGRKVVLKEGRPGTGYCSRRIDAATRIRAEAEQLRRARRVLGERVPKVLACFEREGHVFLAMSRLPGVPLHEWLSQENPVYWGGSAGTGDLARYMRRCESIHAQLSSMLNALHRSGMAIGDLSSANVLVDDHDRVRLIDFEAATDVLATEIGLVSHEFCLIADRVGIQARERDRFALACIAIALVHRSTALLERSASHGPELLKHLEQLFGSVPNWLRLEFEAFETHVSRHSRLRMVNPSTAALGTRVRLETRLRTSDAMAERHAASEAARSLPYGLGHGWGGVLMSGSRPLLRRFSEQGERMISDRRTPPSLYFGTAGVAVAALSVGMVDLAERAVLRVVDDWNRFSDDSIAFGRAGALLAIDRLERATSPGVGVSALRQCVADWVGAPHALRAHGGRSGLLYGLAGTALTLTTAASARVPGWHDVVRQCLQRELARAVVRPRGGLSLRELEAGGRLLPYLGTGSAGLLVTLVRARALGIDLPGGEDAIQGLASDLLVEMSISPGLMEGIAGVYSAHAAVLHELGIGDETVLRRQAGVVERSVVTFTDGYAGVMDPRTAKLDMSWDGGVAGIVEALRVVETHPGRIPWFGEALSLTAANDCSEGR